MSTDCSNNTSALTLSPGGSITIFDLQIELTENPMSKSVWIGLVVAFRQLICIPCVRRMCMYCVFDEFAQWSGENLLDR